MYYRYNKMSVQLKLMNRIVAKMLHRRSGALLTDSQNKKDLNKVNIEMNSSS